MSTTIFRKSRDPFQYEANNRNDVKHPHPSPYILASKHFQEKKSWLQ